ncbi:cytochrome C oxidase subunit II [Planomicrobium sp. CPCC 101079]|nr:cytochrome C oxidase subunit II [Planomicrobium sp. CPCC 101079]TWT13237.1 cytochrome C oxidase subunit II [Planomicrobium sp. CPCC 101079]
MAKYNEAPEADLKGTLICVFLVGLVIVVMWVAAYLMYTAR